MNTLTRVIPKTLPFDAPKQIEAWAMEGALFFGSVSKLEIVTDPKHINAPDAPEVVIFDFTDLLSIDNSALDIIESFQRNLVKHGKILIVVGASEHPLRQMRRLGLAQRLGKYMCPDMETALQLAREALYKKEDSTQNPREEIRIVERK